jgi:hypothetical protein
MYKQLVILLAAGSLTACSEKEEVAQVQAAPVEKAETTLQTYKSQAKSLLADIRTQNTAQELEQSSANLVKTSRKLLSEFTAKYPQCQTYLGALDAAADLIPTLPLEEIETGYHADGKLPKFDDPVCYHAKDLLVHPATVQAIAKQGFKSENAYKDAELEIVEVIAHFDQVERALN